MTAAIIKPDIMQRPERNIQLTASGALKHFLSIEGLSRDKLTDILDTAESFVGVNDKSAKKVPLLRGKTVANLFFENSTRTRTTFELAAKRLSADVLNINVSVSAVTKGETLLDTLRNLQAMQCDMFVVRHASSGAAHFIASHVEPHISAAQQRRFFRAKSCDCRRHFALTGCTLANSCAKHSWHR